MSNHRLGLILVTASAVAWSTGGLFTRWIELDIPTMLAWRGLFGAIGIAVVVLALNGFGAWRNVANMGWPGWTFALVSAAGMVMFITALRNTTVAHVAVIYATAPFLSAGVAWIALRERPARSAVAASLAALAGVAIMVGLGVEGGLFGDLLALGMTLSLAVMMVIARKYPDIPLMPAAGVSVLLSGLVCWPFGTPFAIDGGDLIALALFGLVNSAAGLALFTLGARHLPAIETALIGALDAPLWVWLVFGETPSGNTMLGAAIVFAAVAAHVFADATRPERPQGPEKTQAPGPVTAP